MLTQGDGYKLMLFALISFSVVLIVMKTLGGQKMPVNAGLGFDGLEYAHITKIFPHYWHAFSAYRASRVLPSVIVAIGLKCLHLSFTDENILLGFEYLNMFSLVLAGFCWWRFVQNFRIDTPWRILSFTALFFNCAIITIYSFSPVWTDVLAFSLGMALFYNYFMQRPLLVFISGLLGASVFSTFTIITSLLLLFPIKKVSDNAKRKMDFFSATPPVFYNKILIFLVLSLIVVSFFYLSTLVLPQTLLWHQWIEHLFSQHFSMYLVNRTKSYESLIPTLVYIVEGGGISLLGLLLSSLALLMYLYKGLQPLVGEIDYPIGKFFKKFKKSFSKHSVIVAVSFILSCTMIHHCLTNPELVGSLNPLSFLRVLILETFSLPGVNIIASFVYYGPFIVFVMFYWRDIVAEAAQRSFGCLGVLGLLLLLSITSESRIYINFVGFLVFLTMLAIKNNNRDNISPGVLWFFVLISFCLSKFWISIYMPAQTPETNAIFLTPLWQSYFMNFGPWISIKNYLCYLLILLPCIILAYRHLERSNK